MNNYCKRCGSTDVTIVTNYEYKSEGEISLISGYKCVNCECLHCIDDDQIIWWEYAAETVKEPNAPANYATNYN